MSNIQLSDVLSYNVEQMTFSQPKETTIPGSYRIMIGTQYPNKSAGPLIFCTDLVYSFGIQENLSLEKPPRVTGYSIPLCLWNKEGPTEHQTHFIKAVEVVTDHIKNYLLRNEVKKSIRKYDLELSDLKKFSPLWYKKEDGQIVQGRGPMLYPKLMCDTSLKIYTIITDQNGKDIDAIKLLNEKCTVRACIKFESIFIGSKISLQVKVLELEVQQQGNMRPRLMCPVAPEISESKENEDNEASLVENNFLEKSEDEDDDDVEPRNENLSDDDDVHVSSPEALVDTVVTSTPSKRGGATGNRGRGRITRN